MRRLLLYTYSVSLLRLMLVSAIAAGVLFYGASTGEWGEGTGVHAQVGGSFRRTGIG
jgi:hypothetical protein